MLMGCLNCVICDSSSFHSFIFKLNMLWLLTRWTCVHPIFYAYLIIFLGLLNLDIITSTPPLDYLCVICNSNRFHSFIFKLCIMIVNTLKMCTSDSGPEQSLVLFLTYVLGAQKNCLIETVLLSTHNICFGWFFVTHFFKTKGLQSVILRNISMHIYRPHSPVGSESDCRSRDCEFDPSRVPYFSGDWSWNNFYGQNPSCPDSRRVVVSYVHKVLVNSLVKLAQEKVWRGELAVSTWDVKPQIWNYGPKHIKLTTVEIWMVYFTYILCHWHRHLYAYMYIDCWLYSKTCLKRPLKKKTNYRLMQDKQNRKYM